MPRRLVVLSGMVIATVAFSCMGCVSRERLALEANGAPESAPARADAYATGFQDPADILTQAKPPQAVRVDVRASDSVQPEATAAKSRSAQSPADAVTSKNYLPVAHTEATGISTVTAETPAGTLTIEGRRYRLLPMDEPEAVVAAHAAEHRVASQSQPQPFVIESSEIDSSAINSTRLYSSDGRLLGAEGAMGNRAPMAYSSEPVALDLNLPSALAMVGGQHPAVGLARWRVQEAYARLDQAKVLWLPSLRAGFSFHNHDGNYQASDGRIVDVQRNSFQYGLGVNATGAGTTPQPGVVAQFHLADALFLPKVTQKTAWARGHRANAVVNSQLLAVAIAYLDLLDAQQGFRILEESRDRNSGLAKITADFAAAGEGLQADADRLQTEALLLSGRLSAAEERIDVASARLAEALSIDASQRIVPLDLTVLPLALVSLDHDKGALIQTGLSNRPELKESQALVAAACDEFQRQKYSPFVPSVLLGFSTGGFGGGLGDQIDNVDSRYDMDAAVSWQVRNFGLGEKAARREAASLVQQAKYEKIRVMDQVAGEVARAYSEIEHRRRQIEVAEQAIQFADASYQRNLSRIREGQGLPLEVLQALRALEDAQRAYLSAIIAYNQSQFRLQWALGWPVQGSM